MLSRPNIGARVLGINGPGTVTEHSQMFKKDYEWVKFDSDGETRACPTADLNPLANFEAMGGRPCRFDQRVGQWVAA